jgi:hypothetical protein
MKLIGISIGVNISNYAEYQSKLSLNNISYLLNLEEKEKERQELKTSKRR